MGPINLKSNKSSRFNEIHMFFFGKKLKLYNMLEYTMRVELRLSIVKIDIYG